MVTFAARSVLAAVLWETDSEDVRMCAKRSVKRLQENPDRKY